MIALQNPTGTATRQNVVDMIDAVVDLIQRASFRIDSVPILTPRDVSEVKTHVIKRLNV